MKIALFPLCIVLLMASCSSEQSRENDVQQSRGETFPVQDLDSVVSIIENDLLSTGCHLRSFYISMELVSRGIAAAQLYIYPITHERLRGLYPWRYHVVAAYQPKPGSEEIRVIDPLVGGGKPLTLDQFVTSANGSDDLFIGNKTPQFCLRSHRIDPAQNRSEICFREASYLTNKEPIFQIEVVKSFGSVSQKHSFRESDVHKVCLEMKELMKLKLHYLKDEERASQLRKIERLDEETRSLTKRLDAMGLLNKDSYEGGFCSDEIIGDYPRVEDGVVTMSDGDRYAESSLKWKK